MAQPPQITDLDTAIADTKSKCNILSREIRLLERKLDEAKQQYAEHSARLKTLENEKSKEENRRKIDTLKEVIDSEWVVKRFDWTDKIKHLLKKKFKFDEFHSKQLAAINTTLAKKDLLLVMPTGGGKSLVYQLAALVDQGFTLVIEPLISLIEDQMISLRKLDIYASSIHGSAPKTEVKSTYEAMADKKSGLKLLYVTPEWLAKSKKFMNHLKKAYEAGLVARIAIDEVHCCSSWGHDFRPDYKFLGLLRPILPLVPFIGLTATATMAVLSDVQSMLGMENCNIITDSFNRPNLYYKVTEKPASKESAMNYVAKLLKEDYAGQSGIIYTTTVSESFNLVTELRKRNVKVAPYNAQMESDAKQKSHKRWLENYYQAVVATVAFGMGIDKPDVRFVIHYAMPKSMEGLYQESGRAGRDGLKSDCIVLFSLFDYLKIQGMVSSSEEEKKATSVLDYCLNADKCRRTLIGLHFDEVLYKDDCKGMCDHCTVPKNEIISNNLADICNAIQSVISYINLQGDKATLNKLIDSWYHTGPKKMRVPNIPVPRFSKQKAENVIGFLLFHQYLAIDKGYNNYSTICYLQAGKRPLDDGNIEMLDYVKYAGVPKICLEQEDSDQKPAKRNRRE